MVEKATFAAGCFWGVEDTFSSVLGVVSTRVGYTGGHMNQPTYNDVCSGMTGHAEAVEIFFDPASTSYDMLLNIFWKCHNPTQFNRQGADLGTQYRSAIFYHSISQKFAAEESLTQLEYTCQFRTRIVTEIIPASIFWAAEEFHQKYLQKNKSWSDFL